MFENRVLRKISGPKREGVEGSCRRLHNEELHNLYTSPNITMGVKSMRMRGTGHAARMRDEKCIQILIGIPDANIPLGRPTLRWEDNIKMDLREVG